MRLLKSDFVRYFAFGFGAGLVLLVSLMGGPERGRDMAGGMVPVAEAAPLP